jgi:hypothetical protein
MDGNRWTCRRGGGAVKDIAKIIVAILIIVIAWKILKGLIGLLVGIAVAGLIIYGGMKLIEGPRK